jgi:dTDP-4-dehydrorhamnose reductase
MKRILILGSTGMLGSEVLKVFAKEKNFNITATYKNKVSLNILKKSFNLFLKNKIKFIKFDVTNYNKKSLKRLLSNNQYIINCIGIIKPYIDEKNKKSKTALLVNSIFPHNLNEINKSYKNANIYQIATDCVFSGSKGNYLENSEHDALDIYGKTKSLGEVNDKNFFNIRCSIIGNEIKNYKSLVEWFRMQKKNSELKGFSDHLWNGVTTYVFAEIIKTIVLKKIPLPNLIHIIPLNKISKFELLRLFRKILNRTDITVEKVLSNKKTDRTLGTIHYSLNKLIWSKSLFKKCLNIKNILDTLVKR